MQRPRWGSRAGRPTAGVAGAASQAPLRGEGKGKSERQKRTSKTPASSLRYDGNSNGDGGADLSASLRARKRAGQSERPQVFRVVRERPELHWAAPTCSRNLRLLGISFGRRGGFYFRDRNSAFR